MILHSLVTFKNLIRKEHDNLIYRYGVIQLGRFG